MTAVSRLFCWWLGGVLTLAVGTSAWSQSPPRPNPVDADGMTSIGTHDVPPEVSFFDLPPAGAAVYVWSKLGAYRLSNLSSNSFFVPNRTTAEFEAFLSNLPTGASATTACWSATLSGICSGGTLQPGIEGAAPCGNFSCIAGRWQREAPPYAIFVSNGNFVAPVTGVYRVLAVAGGNRGGDGGYNAGAGGGSGVVAFSEVSLVAGESVPVIVSERSSSTLFGSYLTAPGGGRCSWCREYQNGGSGGAGNDNGAGSCGSDGRARSDGGGVPAGVGQGGSFSRDFHRFTAVRLSCGEGGGPETFPMHIGRAGGGGGGVLINGSGPNGQTNAIGSGHGGKGYGAGGSGGHCNCNYTPTGAGDGAAGVLVIEW